MTTALSTSVHLPDVMALESSYLGRFASGGGLERLSGPPYDGLALQDRFVPYAWGAALNRDGDLVAVTIARP